MYFNHIKKLNTKYLQMYTPCSGICEKAFHMNQMVEIRNGLWMCQECRSLMARKYILQ